MTLLEIGYIALTLVMASIIILGYRKVLLKDQAKNSNQKIFYASLGIVVWLVISSAIALNHILDDRSFPPRLPLLIVLPIFAAIAIILSSKRVQDLITHLPLSSTVYFQSFRIFVETLFIFSVVQGQLHPQVTLEGYNFDMIFGASALLIGFLVFSLNVLPKRIILWWNYLGLGVLVSIIFLFTTTIYFPSFWNQINVAPPQVLNFPFVLVPAFLMPAAVFMHFVSIIRIKKSVTSA